MSEHSRFARTAVSKSRLELKKYRLNGGSPGAPPCRFHPLIPATKARVPHPSQSHREGWECMKPDAGCPHISTLRGGHSRKARTVVTFKYSVSSERRNLKPRNHLEVAHIRGRNSIPKLQRRNTDQQVRERQPDTLRGTLSIYWPGPESDRDRQGLHRQSHHQLVQKFLPRHFSLWRIGSSHTMRQLNQCDH